MPTDIECAYCDQVYRLAGGFSWEIVADRRARWAIPDIFVPVAIAPHCIGWDVPRVPGVPLRHP